MPILSLEISGYRSIRDLRLPLEQVNVVVGPNGCGKSNLYRALFLLTAAARGQLARALAEEGGMPSVLWAGQRTKGPVQVRLGITIDALDRQIVLAHPVMPEGFEEIRVRNLSVGEASVDFTVRRHGGSVSASVERRDGKLDLVIRS